MTSSRAKPEGGRPGAPLMVGEVDLGAAMAQLVVDPDPCTGLPREARILVRLHGSPLGFVRIPVLDGAVGTVALAAAIEADLGNAVREHLAADGVPSGTVIPEGFAAADAPPCREGLAPEADAAAPASIIIATRDRPERLAACLRTILAQSYPRFEVVVVDNAPSGPETRDLVARESDRDPRVRYEREDRPGTSRARNRGLEAARHDHLAFLDDDLDVDHEWLARVMRAFERHPGAGCVTGMIVPAELATRAQWRMEEYGGFTKGFASREYNHWRGDDDGILHPYTAGRFGSGANMAFARAALRVIGGFDPALGGGTPARGGEDLAAFVLTLEAGFSLVYEPSAIVRHYHHRDDDVLRRVLLGYGIGLGAYLTKVVYDRPARLADLAARAGPGLRYLLAPGSSKNQRKGRSYPVALTLVELLGLAAGPYAYLVSRARARLSGPAGWVEPAGDDP